MKKISAMRLENDCQAAISVSSNFPDALHAFRTAEKIRLDSKEKTPIIQDGFVEIYSELSKTHEEPV